MDNLYKQQSLIFKYILYVVAVAFIVFFLPKGGKFKYEFQKGKPWQFENLYAPFDFSIQKTDAEIAKEKQIIENNQLPYYSYDEDVVEKVRALFDEKFESQWSDADLSGNQKNRLRYFVKVILDSVYAKGILQNNGKQIQRNFIFLVKGNEASKVRVSDFLKVNEINELVRDVLTKNNLTVFEKEIQTLFFDIIEPNVSFNNNLTQKARAEALSKLSYTRGTVDQGRLIIAKGEVVEAENLKILESLKSEYESELWTATNYYFILIGYTVLVALVLIMLFLFLKKYRRTVYDNNVKVTFIFFNILLMVFITTMVIKYNDQLVFVVPLCILPLILKTFFDARLGLFVHVLTILILGFVVPNSFEYIFLQIITGIVTILTVSELYKRANLFVSVGQITLIYIIGYLAFHTIHEGDLSDIEWYTLGLFFLNGMITLFVQPLIYIYEKLFGLVSDVSLLELSDTNSKLLKELSNKAPGTFH
ncbi:MAG: phosphohydrolase, partial [Maribacter litoralis]|uniref:phosphohydrolase n=1 Tax=Maribacter litoralis TaxID=2059726 RepID=UPI003297BD26